MIFLFLFLPVLIALLWLFSLRPYCRKNGKGYTPGANIGATFWIDWQEAGEIAKQKGDEGMLMLCRVVLGLQVAWALVFVIMVSVGF